MKIQNFNKEPSDDENYVKKSLFAPNLVGWVNFLNFPSTRGGAKNNFQSETKLELRK